MKLINHTTRYYLSTFLVILFIHTISSYALVRFFVHKRLERSLIKEKKIISQVIEESDSIPLFPGFGENEWEVQAIGESKSSGNSFQIVNLYSSREEEIIEYYELKTHLFVKGTYYEVHVRRSLVQTRELIFSLVASSVLSMLLILLAGAIFYRRLNNKLWQPFFQTLEYLKKFDFNAGKNLKFDQSNIWEFQQLNQHLNGLADKFYQDFQGQKHFVENAAHELQTPLAVIKTQVELVLQSEHLQKEEIQLLASALDAADRLTKINKSLITLSRIENLQFAEKSEVSIKDIIYHNMAIFNMEAKSREIDISYTANDPCQKWMNEALAHILVRNLIQNAIRHNIEGGKAWIYLDKDKLEIKNTGAELEVSTDKLFERFYKNSDSEGSIGLGLPIVKEICDLYEFKIDYTAGNGLHSLNIHL